MGSAAVVELVRRERASSASSASASRPRAPQALLWLLEELFRLFSLYISVLPCCGGRAARFDNDLFRSSSPSPAAGASRGCLQICPGSSIPLPFVIEVSLLMRQGCALHQRPLQVVLALAGRRSPQHCHPRQPAGHRWAVSHIMSPN